MVEPAKARGEGCWQRKRNSAATGHAGELPGALAQNVVCNKLSYPHDAPQRIDAHGRASRRWLCSWVALQPAAAQLPPSGSRWAAVADRPTGCCCVLRLPAKYCWWRCSLQGCRGLLAPSCALAGGASAPVTACCPQSSTIGALTMLLAAAGLVTGTWLHAGHGACGPTANRGAAHSLDAVPPPSQSPCRRTRAPGSGPPLLRAPLAQPSRPRRLGLWEHQPGDQA